MFAAWEKSYDQSRQSIKKQRHHFADKGPHSQSYGFPSSHIWMWELDCKEGWAPKNWCFWIVVLEMTLESPLDSKEIKPVNPKRNQPWILEGLMLKFQYFGHLMWRADSLGKTLILVKIEGRRRRGQQRMRWLDSITDSKDMSLSKHQEMVKNGNPSVQQSLGSQRVGHGWATQQQQLRPKYNSILHSGFYLLCDSVQSNSPLWTSISSSLKWGNKIIGNNRIRICAI